MLGALAGVIGAVLYLIIGVPIAYFISGAADGRGFQPEQTWNFLSPGRCCSL